MTTVMAKAKDRLQNIWDKSQAERRLAEQRIAAEAQRERMAREILLKELERAQMEREQREVVRQRVEVRTKPKWSWTENLYGITEVTEDVVTMKCFDQNGREIEKYTDPEGRMYWRPVHLEETTEPCTPKPENKLVATVHKAGHFPIEWMVEAAARCKESDFLVRIEVEEKVVIVVGHQGDEYATSEWSWQMMEKAETNPLIPAIEHVERQLRVLASLRKEK